MLELSVSLETTRFQYRANKHMILYFVGLIGVKKLKYPPLRGWGGEEECPILWSADTLHITNSSSSSSGNIFPFQKDGPWTVFTISLQATESARCHGLKRVERD